MEYDWLIENGLVFDGKGSPGIRANVAIKNGVVRKITADPIPHGRAEKVIDANGRWVMPGFIDCHTHYDAEVELDPALSESLRHGVTTVVIGSCSLGLTTGTPEELADIFCRVEAIPYGAVRKLLEEKKCWETQGEYLAHLSQLPLGPNIASFLGHSTLRAHVLGIRRALSQDAKPSRAEFQRMEELLEQALDQGFLGMSIMTSPWDKMGGDREYRSRPLPSMFASWSEYRRLTKILRRRGAVFQGVPDLTKRYNIFLFIWESMGLFRKALKTSVLTMMDIRADRIISTLAGYLARFANRVLKADFKWQALPEIFDLWADGFDLVVFEEFGAGAAVLHYQSHPERQKLLRDPEYRAWFRKQWRSRFLPKAFHRRLDYSKVLACPDASLVGKSFTDIAKERGQDDVDTFLDLVAEHGTALRWYTVMANDRPEQLKRIVAHPDSMIGFSDAGAHLRQMAHYNFPLRMLKLVRDAEKEGRPFMTLERAIHKLTGELGEWLGLDAGTLAEGKRADIALIDPHALGDQVEKATEAPMPGIDGFLRLVRRNNDVVMAVWVGGKLAVSSGLVLPEVGKQRGFGRLLRGVTARPEETSLPLQRLPSRREAERQSAGNHPVA